MSLSKQRRESIKHYILEQIDLGTNSVVNKTVEAFEITSTSVYRYIKEMVEDGIIQKQGHSYSLVRAYKLFLYDTKSVEDEMDIMSNDLAPLISECSDNVKRIWQYCLTEMINNVLDHSESERFLVACSKNYMNTTFFILDSGVGIFKKIKDYYKMASLDDAISELFKGKLTTDKERHSGEGIFFSSNAMDYFAAISDGKYFTRNKYEEININTLELNLNGEGNVATMVNGGTTIIMRLSNYTSKTMKEVFDRFSDVENGFFKTMIPIKNIFDDYPVSRSQAKRLVRRCENFKELVLDFAGVEDIGQGFAHELFIVFGHSHPNVKIEPINVNEQVQKMIAHVTRTV
ncbi:MAG: STAS-like domain-containing protein [Lachnospiraceae bacterium]|nr:STAS-like domain-containing protein [Lachnospiraceae bacterium]